MTILEFLASYAALFLQRAEDEGIGGVTVVYTETDGRGCANLSSAAGGEVTLTVDFGLFDELTDLYTPELTDEQWALFKETIRDPDA